MSKLLNIKILAINLIIGLSIPSCKQKGDGISNPQTVVYNNDTINSFVVIKSPRKNLLFIEVLVNKKKAYLLLDTGATMTVFDNNQLSSYGLTSFDTGDEFGGIGGTNNLFQVNNLSFIEIKNKSFFVDIKSSNIGNVVEATNQNSGIKILGILGCDFFNKHEVVFDYGRNIFLINK